MIFREATINDIDNCKIVRMAVNENVLNDSTLVTRADYVDYLSKHGNGWVCEIEKQIVGFSIVGLAERNVWALFMLPKFEGKGIGGALHDLALDWYFMQTSETIWLGTEPKTKAETFYKRRGWTQVGIHREAEIKMEMTAESWSRRMEAGN